MPTSKIQYIQPMKRIGPKSDKDGGGTIVRTFYVEPYSSHKTLLTALKGRISKNGDGTYSRVIPHQDPVFPNYYCFDAFAVPFAMEAITAQVPSGFDPTADNGDSAGNGQLDELKTALDQQDDFDFVNIPDNLANNDPTKPDLSSLIAQGGIDPTIAKEGYISSGRCGAIVTATYYPLIFMPGVTVEGGDYSLPGGPFDYVNPVWTQELINTQTGRSVFFYVAGTPAANILDGDLQGGLSDTYAKPECIWHLSIKRMMVPFLPQVTLGILEQTINSEVSNMGDTSAPTGTLRFDLSENDIHLGPDGSTWYNITLNFSFRKKYDNYYDSGTEMFKNGWIDWNHHFGTPTSRTTGIQVGDSSYWPVSWNSGAFQRFGDNHPLYLLDSDMTAEYASAGGEGNFFGDLAFDPFNNGFKPKQ